MDADQELIEKFLEGDTQAFNRLVQRYQQKIFNLCYRFLGQRAEAEDVAQEVFVTVYKSLHQFRGESLFSTWVFRIAVNHCKNRIKYLGRRSYFQSTSLDQPLETEDGEVCMELVEESPDPEQSLLSDELQGIIQGKINELDDEHRMVIIMRDIQGLSYEEIAKILKLKEGTVKSRIHRARMELKDKLSNILGPPE